jgi:hypothetical protein
MLKSKSILESLTMWKQNLYQWINLESETHLKGSLTYCKGNLSAEKTKNRVIKIYLNLKKAEKCNTNRRGKLTLLYARPCGSLNTTILRGVFSSLFMKFKWTSWPPAFSCRTHSLPPYLSGVATHLPMAYARVYTWLPPIARPLKRSSHLWPLPMPPNLQEAPCSPLLTHPLIGLPCYAKTPTQNSYKVFSFPFSLNRIWNLMY